MRFGIFVYDGVEPIDLATFGVLSMARRVAPAIAIATIAPAAGTVTLSNGLRIVADHGIDDAPACDVVIVTGGPGWAEAARSPATLAYLRDAAGRGRVASVCTGAMLLAASLVDAGGLVTGGGVTLCIDATLHILASTISEEVAAETARIIEYDRARAANRTQFPPVLAGTA